jgi:hypothetical protein
MSYLLSSYIPRYLQQHIDPLVALGPTKCFSVYTVSSSQSNYKLYNESFSRWQSVPVLSPQERRERKNQSASRIIDHQIVNHQSVSQIINHQSSCTNHQLLINSKNHSSSIINKYLVSLIINSPIITHQSRHHFQFTSKIIDHQSSIYLSSIISQHQTSLIINHQNVQSIDHQSTAEIIDGLFRNSTVFACIDSNTK